jgi:hypothetical protein
MIVREVQFTGGDECHVFGNPTDANNETFVSNALARHTPEELRWHFQRRQALSHHVPVPNWRYTGPQDRPPGDDDAAADETESGTLVGEKVKKVNSPLCLIAESFDHLGSH